MSYSPRYRILGHTRIQQLFKWTFVRYGHNKTSVQTIPWTLGEPPFFFFFFFTRGGLCAYNDLQRYITATSVCTTCFMQALYRINHYTGFTLLGSSLWLLTEAVAFFSLPILSLFSLPACSLVSSHRNT